MNNGLPRSFSLARKWSIGLSVTLSVLALLAIVLMVNYVAARHFRRLSLSAEAQTRLSPLTRHVLESVTNEVKVTIYYSKDDPLYDSVWALLKEYVFANNRIHVETVDYERNPSAAQLVKAKYRLSQVTDKNLVIFDSNGRSKVVTQPELSDFDLAPLIARETNTVRRTHFKGEMLFTSAILSVTSLRSLKAYFLQGHDEHRPDSDDKLTGYSEFAAVLRENNILFEKLSLAGPGEVPTDCQLLIIAGPAKPLLPEELDKIDRYLKQGGRLFALFNYFGLNKATGLERLLAGWGVAVGANVVVDLQNSISGKDVVVSKFGSHAVTRPLYESRLHLYLPRTVGKASGNVPGGDTITVEPLAMTGNRAQVITDIRKGTFTPGPTDYIGAVPLLVAVERGRLPGVSAERGSTRLIVTGDSIFLGNETIHSLANRDFASLAVNWLLDRSQLLGSLGPRPVREYRLTMTNKQMISVRWLLLLGMPGVVLLMGLLMSVRRRK
jgi:hypothetical protein